MAVTKLEDPEVAADGVERFIGRNLDRQVRTRWHRSRLQPAFEVCFTTHMWILRTVAEGEPEKTFRVMPGGIRTVGRATGADFIVDAPLVSRVHCRLTALADGGLEVHDLDSTNGTFLNGKRVQTARVSSGDRIGVGRVELVALRDAD
jgi:hypothetical protein